MNHSRKMKAISFFFNIFMFNLIASGIVMKCFGEHYSKWASTAHCLFCIFQDEAWLEQLDHSQNGAFGREWRNLKRISNFTFDSVGEKAYYCSHKTICTIKSLGKKFSLQKETSLFVRVLCHKILESRTEISVLLANMCFCNVQKLPHHQQYCFGGSLSSNSLQLDHSTKEAPYVQKTCRLWKN